MDTASSPRVAVIIPAYNAEAFIGETLESVFSQTLDDFEVVVVNDGSTDNVRAVVQQYDDPRLRYIEQQNQGVSAARNRGVAESTAPLLAFLDADDRWRPDNLAKKVALLEANPAAVGAYSSYCKFDSATGKILEIVANKPQGNLRSMLLLDGMGGLNTCTVLVRRKAFDLTDGFPRRLKASEDLAVWVQLAAIGSFVACDDVLMDYRLHQNQSHQNIQRLEEGMHYIWQMAEAKGWLHELGIRRKAWAALYWMLGLNFLRHTPHIMKGLGYLIRSLFQHPWAAWRWALQKLR